MQQSSVAFGTTTLSFSWLFKERKTIQIRVIPTGDIEVFAPYNATDHDIKAAVKKKAQWIIKNRNFFLQYLPKNPPKNYRSGETYLYLGRQYRLKIYSNADEHIMLRRGYIEVHTKKVKDTKHIKTLLDNWYRNRAKEIFADIFYRIVDNSAKFSRKTPKLYIRHMERRWGSCSANAGITLNIDLLKAPKTCIEYVIYHELCHLIYPHHRKAFYDLMAYYLPDWEKLKRKLENFD